MPEGYTVRYNGNDIINTLKASGGLTVYKTVTGSAGDKNAEFHFTVKPVSYTHLST